MKIPFLGEVGGRHRWPKPGALSGSRDSRRTTRGLLVVLGWCAASFTHAQGPLLPPDGGARGASSLDAQLGGGRPTPPPGVALSEWQWDTRRFVRLGVPEPATLEESVRIGFGRRATSYVRVTFRAKSPSGFPAGSFQGRKEISYTMERVYDRLVIRGARFLAEASGPFKLTASDPPGHTLADFSTLGGIARGTNMVAAVDEAFRGENLFSLDGDGRLTFVNQQFLGSTSRAFPAQIVLEPVL